MDTFESVRQNGSDILFSLHEFDPPISPVQDHKATSGLDGAQIMQNVLCSARVKNAVAEMAAKQGKAVEVVLTDIKAMLEDIGHTFTLKSIRFMAYLLRKVFRNIYSGIKINMKGLNKVQEMAKECPVVFVPSHRSYTDFLLVSFICFIFQLPLPVIAAAEDFKSMKLIGGLLRNCGAFYMKRSFRSDKLYWVVFSEYVQCLLLNSGTTMEFFLEGTRSRSGKSLHPKKGLLSIITDLYFTSRVPDIMFCPISISYDRVLEESLMAQELLGVPKPKESLKGLLSARSVLSDDYGYVYMHFGNPISLREFSEGLVNRAERSCVPRSIRSEATSDEMKVVRKLAGHISEKIQDYLIVLPNMIVASILLQTPSGINLECLTKKYEEVLGWCKSCNILTRGNDNGELRQDISESLQLLKSSVMVTENSDVSLLDSEGFPKEFKARVYALLEKVNLHENSRAIARDTGHLFDITSGVETTTSVCGDTRCAKEDSLPDLKTLKAEEKNYIVHLTCIHIQLAHQRNQLLHWFYIPAISALAVRNYKNCILEAQLYNKAKFIGDLVCGEIAGESFPSKQDFVSSLAKFTKLGMFNSCAGWYTITQNEAFCFISGLWSPVLTAYWVVCSYILDSCREGDEYETNTLIQSCQEYALQLFLKGTLHYLEIRSLEVLKNGLKSIRKREIVKQIKRDSEHMIVISNRSALYNVTATLGEILQLNSSYQPILSSKL